MRTTDGRVSLQFANDPELGEVVRNGKLVTATKIVTHLFNKLREGKYWLRCEKPRLVRTT